MSAIVLAGEDRLTMSDLSGLDIDADLVVLSACDSGRGAATMSGELVGLSRSLLLAGVRRCVVSLWPVDDATACVLMVEFHKQLRLLDPAATLFESHREVRSLSSGETLERYAALKEKSDVVDTPKLRGIGKASSGGDRQHRRDDRNSASAFSLIGC